MRKLFSGPTDDDLTVEMKVDISKRFINVSKHKRILTPVINESIILYANGSRLNEDDDEVFVVAEFFKSLAHPGKRPMYTCSCGIFGCGGFYIDVKYTKHKVRWGTEQATFKPFVFSKENVRRVARQLINDLTELHRLRKENGLETYHDLEDYRAKLDLFH